MKDTSSIKIITNYGKMLKNKIHIMIPLLAVRLFEQHFDTVFCHSTRRSKSGIWKQNNDLAFKNCKNHNYYPRTNLNAIRTELKRMRGTLTTVLIDLTRFRSLAVTVGCSPKPCTWALAPQPIRFMNLSSWRTQIAFRIKTIASIRCINVKDIVELSLVTVTEDCCCYVQSINCK